MRSTTTDEVGAYSIDGLELGAYQVAATARENTSTNWYGGGFGVRDAAAVVTLDALAPTADSIDIQFPTGGFGGWISGPNGTVDPFFGASATFTGPGGFTETVPILDNGAFGIGYIPVGLYELTVDWPTGTYTFPDPFETGPTGLSMSVAVPGILSGTVLTDGASELLAPYNGGGQQPVPAARVTVVDASTGAFVAERIADDAGFYSFETLPVGTYQISATARGNSTPLWYGASGTFGDRLTANPDTIAIIEA